MKDSKKFWDGNSFHSLSFNQIWTSDLEAKALKYPISSPFQFSYNEEESIEKKVLKPKPQAGGLFHSVGVTRSLLNEVKKKYCFPDK